MTDLSAGERVWIAARKVGRIRRSLVAALHRHTPLRRLHGLPHADQLLILPQDLHSADPGFAIELADGHFGTPGGTAAIGMGSPFDAAPPNDTWSRELHGFGWLRDLRIAQTDATRERARALVAEWVRRFRTPRGLPWEPGVVARRTISWITHATYLLEDADPRLYADLTDRLGEQIVHLSVAWREAPEGMPRLLSLTALIMAGLCVAGHDRQLARSERALLAELERQIFEDGGHRGRNPQMLVDLLLELLPLRQCFIARKRPVPPVFDRTIARMQGMLRLLRLGDGSVARFNGMGATSAEALATIFAYDDAAPRATLHAPQSGYVRLARGTTVLIADLGPPPPLAYSGEAHAGCLSFELSLGTQALFINAGAPPPAYRALRMQARTTPSHSTLAIADHSSGKLITDASVVRELDGTPLVLPRRVETRIEERDGGAIVAGSHDGYLRRFRLIHRRQIRLSADGLEIAGEDWLGPRRGVLRLARDLPFAIRFHLHPAIDCRAGTRPGSVELYIPGGLRAELTSDGAQLTLESADHFSGAVVPQATMQVVLRGRCAGEQRVRWQLTRTG